VPNRTYLEQYITTVQATRAWATADSGREASASILDSRGPARVDQPIADIVVVDVKGGTVKSLTDRPLRSLDVARDLRTALVTEGGAALPPRPELTLRGHPEYLAGGSSSGSAVAVSTGLVTFALGTDTAGSGRVPAAFTNIVGL
jgi:hypothetical protein